MRRAILVFILVIVIAFVSRNIFFQSIPVGALDVYLFDVGQGDAMLIQTSGGVVVLDGGPDDALVEKLGRHLPRLERNIEFVVLTHPDHDHLVGLTEVIERYQVQQVLQSSWKKFHAEVTAFFETANRQQVPIQLVQAGDRIHIGTGWSIQVLFPDTPFRQAESTNDRSLVLYLSNGEQDILLMGDADVSSESHIMNQYPEIFPVDVLKIGHHGSCASSSKAFLNKTQPQIVLISVGENRYGHPCKEVLNRIREQGAKIFRSDLHQDIHLRFWKGKILFD